MSTGYDLLLDLAKRFGSVEDFKTEAEKVYTELSGNSNSNSAQERSFYTVADVARRWGCTDTHVRRQIDAGRLKAYKLGKGYRVTSSELTAYERRNACHNGAIIQ